MSKGVLTEGMELGLVVAVLRADALEVRHKLKWALDAVDKLIERTDNTLGMLPLPGGERTAIFESALGILLTEGAEIHKESRGPVTEWSLNHNWATVDGHLL